MKEAKEVAPVKDVATMTAAELKDYLKKAEAKEKVAARKKRAKYEDERDELVRSRVKQARRLNKLLTEFKTNAIDDMEQFKVKALSYGDIRKNSKGGFGLRCSETGEKMTLDRNLVVEYDERATTAELLIKDFLEDKVKKNSRATFQTITTLMSKNKAGDYTPAMIGKLLSIRDNYDDERWQKAMKLFEESYTVQEVSYSMTFYEKDEQGKDMAICLSFASVPVPAAVKDVEDE